MTRPDAAPRRTIASGTAALAAVMAAALHAAAADLPPEVVASFTQRVQPLLLNRCASGACHGAADAPAPRLRRGVGSAPLDQSHTRANLAAFLDAVGPARDPRPLAASLAVGHPAGSTAARRAPPLGTPERLTLDRWLAQVREAEARPAIVDAGVVPVSAEEPVPAPPRPNRFRALLDSAAHPPDLPPPEAPRGVIFKNDPPPDE